MPRREDPEFTLKIAVVGTRWPGASAEKMEELVTDPLEEAIDGMEEARLIRSTSSSEQSVIFVELEEWLPGAKIDDAWDRVRERVENVEMPRRSDRRGNQLPVGRVKSKKVTRVIFGLFDHDPCQDFV